MSGTRGRFLGLGTAAAAILLGVAAGAEAPRANLIWVPAQMADASDRAYEPTAIHLIDHAEGAAAVHDLTLDDLHARTGLSTQLLSRARRELEQW